MRKLYTLITLGILATLLVWPVQASMKPPVQSQLRLGEPAHVQHERVRMQIRTVHEQLRLRRQRADAASAQEEDRRSKSVETGDDPAIER